MAQIVWAESALNEFDAAQNWFNLFFPV